MNNKGYILVGMTFMMILMAVAAVGMNRKAGMQTRIAANRARSAQTHFGQRAALEHARWNILQNPTWRTSDEDYVFEGVTYNRKVEDCAVPGYEDAITVSVTAPGGLNPMKAYFRWQLVERSTSVPRLYIADEDNNRIRMVDMDSGIITTVAGTGTQGYSGDGGLATNANINDPNSVFVDTAGNIFIADEDNHRIRKVDGSTGIITTVAGTGSAGYSGDGGPATSAKIELPYGFWVDSEGSIFFGDVDNHRVRKVDGSTGIITTIAGTGSQGFSGDDGPATSAKLYLRYDSYVFGDDNGNIYFSDDGNQRIRKVDGDTGVITTVAGNGDYGFSGDGGSATNAMLRYPCGLSVNASGDIYFADQYNHRIRKVDGETGIITTVAGKGLAGFAGDGGLATNAKLNYPTGVFANIYGDFYIADMDNSRIRKVDGATGIITTVAGTGSDGYSGDGGPATSADLHYPPGVFERTLYVSLPPSWGFTLVEKLY